MSKNKIMYSEPADYFPEEVRRKYGLGEFNTDSDKPVKKTVKKTKPTKKKGKADQINKAMKANK